MIKSADHIIKVHLVDKLELNRKTTQARLGKQKISWRAGRRSRARGGRTRCGRWRWSARQTGGRRARSWPWPSRSTGRRWAWASAGARTCRAARRRTWSTCPRSAASTGPSAPPAAPASRSAARCSPRTGPRAPWPSPCRSSPLPFPWSASCHR